MKAKIFDALISTGAVLAVILAAWGALVLIGKAVTAAGLW